MDDNTISKIFDIEAQYQFYLKKVKLKEAEMHPTQRVETKRAFMAGMGQTLFLLRDGVGGLPNERQAIVVLEDLTEQVKRFWNNI